jgi:hypothetical protein
MNQIMVMFLGAVLLALGTFLLGLSLGVCQP